jgi:FKBP-type peptidyl-prolyl cis-trans isomerase
MKKQTLGVAVMLAVVIASLFMLYRAKPVPTDQIQTEDIVVGKGPVPKMGQLVSVNYRLTSDIGEKLDSSYDRGVPFTFTIGAKQVVDGFDMAVRTMHVGGKRKATIPPALGYGSNPPLASNIMRDATLVFEIELLSAK